MEDFRNFLTPNLSFAQPFCQAFDPRCTCSRTTQVPNQEFDNYNDLKDKQENSSFTSQSSSSLKAGFDGIETGSAATSLEVSSTSRASDIDSGRVSPNLDTHLGDPPSSPSKLETNTKPSSITRKAKQRKSRTLFSSVQINILENVFDQYHYIASSQRKLLAQNIGISEAQVRVWFQNRRIKWRKEGNEFLVKM